ncbi:hypothetical protein EJB05_53464, partial [Eragrostis curvula]
MDATVLCAARNNVPLTPISFLQRSAVAYPNRIALVASGRGSTPHTWRETWVRCVSLAAALVSLGVSRHDVVAVFAQNIPAVCELHFGIPMAGAVICALNSRLDAAMTSTLLSHSEARVIFVDSVLLDVAQEALTLMTKAGARRPLLVLIKEDLDESSQGLDANRATIVPTDHYEYEALINIAPSTPYFSIRWPADENDPIALNYTSGTTSRPKGVVCSHRGAYLNSIAPVLMHDMASAPVYLWTVPMFHCNGWCLVWGVAAKGGTNVCLRRVTAAAVFDAIARHGVTHVLP